MSRLRAKCPDCRTLTAVALGGDYECHSCGRSFRAGLVRVPRAWGTDGEAMVAAAELPLPYPEVATIEEGTLIEQNLALAAALPERPLVLGGCCCIHVGAVEGLAARHGRIALVWFDAHGDLNTPETSVSGNEWGMPFRMILDSGTVDVEDSLLLGARNLDPPENDFIRASGLRTNEDDLADVLADTSGVYVAFDVDVLAPGQIGMHYPEAGGPDGAEVSRTLAEIVDQASLVGVGFSGLNASPQNSAGLRPFIDALGL